MDQKIEKLKVQLADEAFVKELFDAENEQEVQKMLADKGIEMSLTEIELMSEMLEDLQAGNISGELLEKLANGGELSDDELEGAAGGNILYDFFTKDTGLRKYFVDGMEVTVEGFTSAYMQGANTTMEQVRKVSGGAVALAAAGVIALGVGIYSAVRRRW